MRLDFGIVEVSILELFAEMRKWMSNFVLESALPSTIGFSHAYSWQLVGCRG